MNIHTILQELDQLFAAHEIDKVEGFLIEYIGKAELEGDIGTQVGLYNELMGFYRDQGAYGKSIEACEAVLGIIERAGLEGSVSHATTLQNVANAYRAAGKLEDSLVMFQRVFCMYQRQLASNDMRYASLNNNMSLLYQEMKDYENACNYLQHALSIVLQHPEAIIEVATTHTNLALSLLKLKKWDEAMTHLQCAFDIFERSQEKDYHYSGALAAMAEAKYLSGRLEEAVYYYREAMKEIERNVGKTQNYIMMEQNLELVYKKLGYVPSVVKGYKKGLDLCHDFYQAYGAPMIHEKFPQYEETIAVGLVGEGSDCFGFDDEFSRDHDFGPGFCMWLTDAAYDDIGVQLEEAYQELPTSYMGVTRRNTPQAGKRVGVFRIGDFYQRLIGSKDIPESNHQWLFVEDYQLASATNGRVFRDDLGEFTRIRQGLLAYYPEEVYVKKVARYAALMAQTGQYNYGRMLKRKDRVTAHIAVIEFIKYTMGMSYLLNRSYGPFYKWQYRGLQNSKLLSQLPQLIYQLQELPIGHEDIPFTIEEIAALIIKQMQIQGLTLGTDTFLDTHTKSILTSIETRTQMNIGKRSKEELIKEIIELEWSAFDKVKNQGGVRADCQDDWQTFSIMRRSQFEAWTEELLVSYMIDFKEANQRGWNLITEKYGRMMESTNPEEYQKIKEHLPELSQQKKMLIEGVVKVQVGWMEELALKYPKISGNARSIHTWEDTPYHTSYETYLRGELATYSEKTVQLYGQYIVSTYQNQQNLAENIIENTARLYGFIDIENMEKHS